MQKQFEPIIAYCNDCRKPLTDADDMYTTIYPHKPKEIRCFDCHHKEIPKEVKPLFKKVELKEDQFNEPEHYHQHGIDTIKFLQEGFPPDVFASFCMANIVKYTQRTKYKNGRDDIAKVVDYAKRWLDWYDKTHS